MTGFRVARLLSSTFAAACLFSACSLRLPVESQVIHSRVSANASATSVPVLEKPVDHEKFVLIWLLADTLHTGMVFPYDWLLESGYVPPEGFGNPRYVSMSWGNRDAYVEKRWLSPWKAARALFTPSPSVMEIIPITWDVAEVVPHQRIYRKLLERSNGPALAEFLNDCSHWNENDRPINIGPSSWGGGMLLESRYRYFFPRICNVWTAQAIEASGGEVNPWLGITANGIIRQAERPPNNYEKIWNGPEEEPEPTI